MAALSDVWGPVGFVVMLFAAMAGVAARRRTLSGRELRRPYRFRSEAPEEEDFPNAVEELCKIVTFLQDSIIVPIDKRLPGRPFEFDLHSFPFTPMVLVIGNHSSGKSTFINWLFGLQAQETGVAPTDDGFTVLERSDVESVEDGPTVLGCPENRPFRELQRFGQAFSGHFRRKRKWLPEGAIMPPGLQIVDTPGMIDLPVTGCGTDLIGSPSERGSGSQGSGRAAVDTIRGRGYNFVEVVRWWAKRADLILLLFDPDKPGTTGETLEVLTKSLAGLDHKVLVVLNKVDQLDNSIDFARAYGTLGWALAKVIRRKDIPQVYTMYNAGLSCLPTRSDHKLPLESFAKRRDEVVAEVLRARDRHFDNVVTSLEETLREVAMVATIVGTIRARAAQRVIIVALVGCFTFASPIGVHLWFLATERLDGRSIAATSAVGVCALYILWYMAVTALLREHLRSFRRLQLANLDDTFEEEYADFFIHNDGEDHRARWLVVRPKLRMMLTSIQCPSQLQPFPRWEVARIDEVLKNDVWHLRQLARLLRMQHKRPQIAAVPRQRR